MASEVWHIYKYEAGDVRHLRAGSVRFGRTMRAAKALAQYTAGKVFLSQAAPQADPGWRPPLEDRHYTQEAASLEEAQRGNRAKLGHHAGDERTRLAAAKQRGIDDAIDAVLGDGASMGVRLALEAEVRGEL